MNLKMIACTALVGLSLGGCVESGASDGYDRNVLVQNQTRKTVYNFYGSNVSRTSYEEDILGNIVLRPGESVSIDFDDGSGYCNFDFKVVFSDGSYFTEDNVDVCRISSYTIR